jgi:hypothetical protein
MAEALADDLEGHRSSWFWKLLALLLFSAVGVVGGYFLTKHTAKSEKAVVSETADPCAACKAQWLEPARPSVSHDEAHHRYVLDPESSSCMGSERCSGCIVVMPYDPAGNAYTPTCVGSSP